MLSTVCFSNEQCVVGNKRCAVVEATHGALGEQTQKQQGACCVTCVLAGLRAHYTTHAIPQTQKRRKAEKGREQRIKKRNIRVVLDGGGARLADAATRHHLTQTQQRKEKSKEEEER